MSDRILRATAGRLPFRFVLLDLTRTANHIGSLHGARAHALQVLAETAMSSLLLASGLKYAGTVSLTLEFSGDLSQVQADSTPMGLVRATIPQDEVLRAGDFELLLSPLRMRVRRLNEHGKLARESIVEAASLHMGHNLSVYMLHSEQIRSAVGVFSTLDPDTDTRLRYATAFLAEAFPEASERDLELIDERVRALPHMDKFFGAQGIDLNAILSALIGSEPAEIVRELRPQHHCPCNKSRTLASLAAMPVEDLQALENENSELEIVCDFCRTHYHISPEELRQVIAKKNQIPPNADNDLD